MAQIKVKNNAICCVLIYFAAAPPVKHSLKESKGKCLDDEPGMLLFELTRFAEVFRPQAILIERVKELLGAPKRNGKIGGVFELLLVAYLPEKLGGLEKAVFLCSLPF